jgi:hypothetical protein
MEPFFYSSSSMRDCAYCPLFPMEKTRDTIHRIVFQTLTEI